MRRYHAHYDVTNAPRKFPEVQNVQRVDMCTLAEVQPDIEYGKWNVWSA